MLFIDCVKKQRNRFIVANISRRISILPECVKQKIQDYALDILSVEVYRSLHTDLQLEIHKRTYVYYNYNHNHFTNRLSRVYYFYHHKRYSMHTKFCGKCGNYLHVANYNKQIICRCV